MRWKPTPSHTNMEFILCWLIIPWLRPALQCGWYTQWHAIGENLFNLSQKVSTASSFSARHGTLHPLPLFRAWILSSLTLLKSYACFHSFCEFIFISVLLYLEDSVSISSISYNLSISSSALIPQPGKERRGW